MACTIMQSKQSKISDSNSNFATSEQYFFNEMITSKVLASVMFLNTNLITLMHVFRASLFKLKVCFDTIKNFERKFELHDFVYK